MTKQLKVTEINECDKVLKRLHNRCSLCGRKSSDVWCIDMNSFVREDWNMDCLCSECRALTVNLIHHWKCNSWNHLPKTTVFKEIKMRSAHQLKDGYEGKCKRVHGEYYKIQFRVSSITINQFGMVIDFNAFDTLVKDKYDHYFLNEIEPFNKVNPTAENIARVLFWKLNEIFHALSHKPRLEWIKVIESDEGAYAEYTI